MARPFKVFIPEQKEQFGVVARSLRLSTESAGTQTPAVLSIKIAKVQENVQWENEGKRFLLKYILWLPMQSLWTSL